MPSNISRPRHTLLYAPRAVIAQLHITHAAAVDMEKVFPFDPVPGAGNAATAETAARAWVNKMEQDLGFVRYAEPYRPGEMVMAALAIVILYMLLQWFIRL